MMSRTVSMGSSGAVVADPRPNLGLLSAFTLPRGGMLCVDLLRPTVPIELTVHGAEFTDDIREYVTAYRDGRPAELPNRWLRLATVVGVDRWMDAALDEQLVAADRALALVEAGDAEGGAAAYAPVADHLLDYGTAIVADPSMTSPAVVAELLRITEAVGSADLAAALHQISPDAGLGFTAESVQRPAASGGVRHLHHDYAITGQDLVEIDHQHVPARLIDGPLAIRLQQDQLVVTAQPYPTVRADHPAACRLVVRLVDTVDNSVIVQRPFELIGSSFQSSLDLRGRPLTELAVDVVDLFGMRPPRVDQAGLAQRSALASAQRAYQTVRSALAALTLDRHYEDAARRFELARADLAGVPDQFASIVSGVLVDLSRAAEAIEWHKPEQAGAAYVSDGARPLLAELELAARH
jgi:hypothetical protein